MKKQLHMGKPEKKMFEFNFKSHIYNISQNIIVLYISNNTNHCLTKDTHNS